MMKMGDVWGVFAAAGRRPLNRSGLPTSIAVPRL
jgi:hypothetical protein